MRPCFQGEVEMALGFANNRAVHARALAEAEPDDNIIHGTDGNDTLVATFLTTALYGYGGDDLIESETRGDHLLYGGTGQDSFYISRNNSHFPEPGSVQAFGEDGDDVFHIDMKYGEALVSGGDGEDVFRLFLQQGLTLTGGSGRDTYILEREFKPNWSTRPINITDFETGTGGDAINLAGLFDNFPRDVQSPFAAGFFRLLQADDDTHFEVLLTLSGQPEWVPIVSFSNTLAADFVAENLYGLLPHGGDPVGLTLFGDDTDNEILAGFGDDVVYAQQGQDTVYGFNGDDRIFGGDGDDYLAGGFGDDVLRGGVGRDTLWGDVGNDLLIGGDGFDNLSGGDGSDILYGYANDDNLRGGNGDDFLDGGDHRDDLYGGDGNDRLFGGNGADHLRGNDGNDSLHGGTENDLLEGGDGNDELFGEEGFDILEGGGGDDQLFGGEGIDFLYGDDGDDRLDGGAGNDRLYGGLGSNILNGGIGDDFLSSTEGENSRLSGGDGDDAILLVRHSGTSTVVASADDGADMIEVDIRSGKAFVSGGSGEDHFTIRSGGTLSGDADRDTFDLTPDLDAFQNFKPVVIVDFETGAGGDVLRVDHVLNHLSNLTFEKLLESGHFRLIQSGPNSVFEVDRDGGGDDWTPMIYFANTDVTTFTADNFDGVPANGSTIPGLTLFGDEGPNHLLGGGWSDSIHGLGGHDTLSGGGGDDQIFGGAGNDFLKGDAGSDILHGDLGNDELVSDYAESGNDKLFGGAGNDIIRTSRSSGSTDILQVSGGDGSDRFWVEMQGGKAFISGDEGMDTFEILSGGFLSGGTGVDTFRINAINFRFYGDPSQRDNPAVIVDFEMGAGGDIVDTLSLQGRLTNGPLENPFNTGHFRLVQQGAHAVFQVDRDGGGDDWVPVMYFANRDVGDFTAENFDGLPPDGSKPEGQVITGGRFRDWLAGGWGDDTLYGLALGDALYGRGGDDILYGGAGNDYLEGGLGADILYGEDGPDKLHSGTDAYDVGDDQLFGGAGDDEIKVSRLWSSNDFVRAFGGDGDDSIYIVASGSQVIAEGGAGEDSFYITAHPGARVFASGGAGEDTFHITHGGIVSGGADSDRFIVDALSVPTVITDFETGKNGDVLEQITHLHDSPAANPFESGHYRLTQNGAHTEFQVNRDGLGDDWRPVVYFANTDVADFTAENFNGLDPLVSMNAMAEMANEPITGDDDPNTIEGTEGDDIIYGQGGDDTLIGNGGDDLIQGGAGNDYLNGGAGTDILHGEFGDDELVSDVSGSGDARLYGGRGDDTFRVSRTYSSADVLQASGGEGADTFDVEMWGGKAFLSGGAGQDYLAIKSGGFLSGGADVDTFFIDGEYYNFSSDPSNRSKPTVIVDFETGAGGDIVDTTSLQDLLTFGPRENPFNTGHFRLVQQGAHTVFEVDIDGNKIGWVPVMYFANTDLDDFTAENFNGLPPDGSKPAGQTITGTSDADSLTGGWGDDIIYGLAADDELFGGGGEDRLHGGSGNDYLNGGPGDDVLYGEAGNDTLTSGLDFYDAGDDRLFGGEGDDEIRVIRGGSSRDKIIVSGDAGNDTIYLERGAWASGGDGEDVFHLYTGSAALSGGADSDLFIMHHSVGSYGAVVFTEFETGMGGDVLDTVGVLNRLSNSPAENPFKSGHYRLIQNGANTELQVDFDGIGGHWRSIVFFANTNVGDFTAENFNGLDPMVDASSAASVVIDDTLSMPSDELIAEVPESSPLGLGYVEETDLLMW